MIMTFHTFLMIFVGNNNSETLSGGIENIIMLVSFNLYDIILTTTPYIISVMPLSSFRC